MAGCERCASLLWMQTTRVRYSAELHVRFLLFLFFIIIILHPALFAGECARAVFAVARRCHALFVLSCQQAHGGCNATLS